jgi:hypothetical protein
MSLNSKKQPPSSGEGLKQLYLKPEGAPASGGEYFPFFYAEARIDFNDVRTGLRETVSLSKALEIYPNIADLLWTEDMVRDVDFGMTTSAIPGTVSLNSLPDFVDAHFIAHMEIQFVQYLLRSFVARVYRNYALNIYSHSGESRTEFAGRCRELLEGPRRKEADRLHEVFKRKLEQAKEKYLLIDVPPGLELAKSESQKRNSFYRSSERIADFFLRGDVLPNLNPEATPGARGATELEERLLSLETEARHAIDKLQDSYQEKAQALDEYLLHPNPKDIHFVKSCILWMPHRAA